MWTSGLITSDVQQLLYLQDDGVLVSVKYNNPRMCTYKRNRIACKDYALFSMFSCQSHSYCTRFSLLIWEVEISEKVCITHMHVYLHVNWCRKSLVYTWVLYTTFSHRQDRQEKSGTCFTFTLHPSHNNNIQPVAPHSEECMHVRHVLENN